MAHRFFVEGSQESDLLLLEGSEAHHLLHVLRMQEGDSVWVFDGTGAEAEAVITKTARKSVEIKITERFETQMNTEVPVILATAVPKGDRFRWLIEKAAELGVTRVVPLITERSSVDPGANRLKKLQQTIISAAKQSGQTRLMELAPLQTWEEFLVETCQQDCRLLIADPAGYQVDLLSQTTVEEGKLPVFLMIGPEGGFSSAELESAINKGAKSVKLSEGILRIETAAILFAGLVRMSLTQSQNAG